MKETRTRKADNRWSFLKFVDPVWVSKSSMFENSGTVLIFVMVLIFVLENWT
jgi:hypothetical protein